MQATLSETTPPGWEDVTARMRAHAEASDPVSAAWWLYDRGAKPHTEAGTPYQALALWKRYEHGRKREQREAASAAALGALARADTKPVAACESAATAPSRGHVISEIIQIREASKPAADGSIPVILIAEGPGNKRDRHYYTAEALRESVKVFDGISCFLDHPGQGDNPERSVRDKCGWYSRPRISSVEGRTCIVADLHLAKNAAGNEARALMETDREYRRQHPDKVWAGFSIIAEGEAHTGEIDGENWSIVDGFDRALSTDIVTFPAAGGKALDFRESASITDSYRFRATVRTLFHVEQHAS